MVSLSKTSNRKISRTYLFCKCQYVGEGCQNSRDAKSKALFALAFASGSLVVVTFIIFFPCNDKNSFIYRTKKENEDSKHPKFDKVAEAPI